MSMELKTLLRHRGAALCGGTSFPAWLCALCVMCAAASARGQDTAAPLAAPAEIPASADTAPTPEAAPAPSTPASPELARLDAARALGEQLLELERRAQQIELERSRIRLLGPRIGKIVSWIASAVFLSSAVSAWGRAESVKEALDDGRDDKAYDTDRDGDVDKDDEERSRRVARALVGTSLVPIGLGVFSTLLERKRRRAQRALGYELEDIATKRRALLTQLGVQLGVAPGHAALRLHLAF